VETSICSYLAAHPRRDVVVSAWQEVTGEFWDQHPGAYALVTSERVIEERGVGDLDAIAAAMKKRQTHWPTRIVKQEKPNNAAEALRQRPRASKRAFGEVRV